jgi:type II secretory pathway pseudopilin PulG
MKINDVACQKGFTLVQMAVILVIVGLTVGSFFAALEVTESRDRDQRTKDMQQVVAGALTDYIQRVGRLPCPANPAETDVQKLGQERTNCLGAATQRVGVVPFATLGLAPSEILDGYGNPMTFAVQVNIAQAPDPINDVVYGPCRTSYTNGWMPIAGGVNVNPVKAILCCRPVADGDRLRVFASNGPAGAAIERIGAQVIHPT